MPAAPPPGWPGDLPGPDAAEFGDRVTNWLLDRGPGEWRSHPVLRRHPRALSRLLIHHLDARLAGLRTSYSAARRELADVVPGAEFADLLAAIEADGVVTTEMLRQARLVDEALSGRRWRSRL